MPGFLLHPESSHGPSSLFSFNFLRRRRPPPLFIFFSLSSSFLFFFLHFPYTPPPPSATTTTLLPIFKVILYPSHSLFFPYFFSFLLLHSAFCCFHHPLSFFASILSFPLASLFIHVLFICFFIFVIVAFRIGIS